MTDFFFLDNSELLYNPYRILKYDSEKISSKVNYWVMVIIEFIVTVNQNIHRLYTLQKLAFYLNNTFNKINIL